MKESETGGPAEAQYSATTRQAAGTSHGFDSTPLLPKRLSAMLASARARTTQRTSRYFGELTHARAGQRQKRWKRERRQDRRRKDGLQARPAGMSNDCRCESAISSSESDETGSERTARATALTVSCGADSSLGEADPAPLPLTTVMAAFQTSEPDERTNQMGRARQTEAVLGCLACFEVLHHSTDLRGNDRHTRLRHVRSIWIPRPLRRPAAAGEEYGSPKPSMELQNFETTDRP
jgi:hypothetical protein